MNQQRSPLEKRNALEKGKKRGCCGSPQLEIVVPTRSWREISLRKTQQTQNSLNFASTCLKVVDTRRVVLQESLKVFKAHKTWSTW